MKITTTCILKPSTYDMVTNSQLLQPSTSRSKNVLSFTFMANFAHFLYSLLELRRARKY